MGFIGSDDTQDMKGQRLGAFEELVLLAVCILEAEAYGVAVRREIATHTGQTVSLGAVHATLYRLEDKGYLSSRLGGATAERGGRHKRVYKLTEQGRAALIAIRSVEQAMWADVTVAGLTRG